MIRRRKPIRRYNRERRRRLNAETFGPQAELARRMPCLVCGRRPPSDPAHVRSRGAGGRDRGNVVPLCRACHMRQGAVGARRFGEETGLDLHHEALTLERVAYQDAKHRQELVAEAQALRSPLGSEALERLTVDELDAHVCRLSEAWDDPQGLSEAVPEGGEGV